MRADDDGDGSDHVITAAAQRPTTARASRNNEIIQRFYCLAFVRKRDPCLAVFALCGELMAGLIHFVGKDGRLAFRAHTAALRDLFLGGDVEDLRLCRPRV